MEQQNQDLKKILQAILPTKAEIIYLLSISFGILILIAGLGYFKAIDNNGYRIVAQNIEIVIRNGLALFDKYIGVGPLTLVFWMLVGSIVYSLVWVISSTYSAYKNDLPDTKGLVVPREYKRSQAIHESIAKISIRTASLILLLLWIYMLLTKIAPYCIELFSTASSAKIPATIINVSISVVVLAVSIFLISVLTRLSVLRTRVFYK